MADVRGNFLRPPHGTTPAVLYLSPYQHQLRSFG